MVYIGRQPRHDHCLQFSAMMIIDRHFCPALTSPERLLADVWAERALAPQSERIDVEGLERGWDWALEAGCSLHISPSSPSPGAHEGSLHQPDSKSSDSSRIQSKQKQFSIKISFPQHRTEHFHSTSHPRLKDDQLIHGTINVPCIFCKYLNTKDLYFSTPKKHWLKLFYFKLFYNWQGA